MAPRPSGFAPLKHPLFRKLWTASVVSNLGTWLQEVAQAWLMTSLTSSPLVVSLVQASDSLAVFLFSLPAGALADMVDRRRLLIATQTWMMLVALSLALLTLTGGITWWVLLITTFAMSTGNAFNAPAWQSTLPHVVEREEVPNAITLNSIGFNLARVVGPALGGTIVAAFGAAANFFLNSLSFLAVIRVLAGWRRKETENVARAERVIGAIRNGLRYARHATTLQNVLVRSALYPFFLSALWSLLPIFAKQEMGTGSAGYGLFLGSLGTGAVMAALALPRLRARYSPDRIVGVATILGAVSLILLAYVRFFPLLCLVLVIGGIGWMCAMSSFNVGVQTSVPSWVRARALSLYYLSYQGGMASGSVAWGAIAGHVSIPAALAAAGAGLALTLPFARRLRLAMPEEPDFTPAAHWAEPHPVIPVEKTDGPILVTVEYFIDPAQADAFRDAMESVGRLRKRDGAIQWGLFADAAKPERYVETYLVESWGLHLLQHQRVTVSDKRVEVRARAFHVGAIPPVVDHFVYAYESRGLFEKIR